MHNQHTIVTFLRAVIIMIIITVIARANDGSVLGDACLTERDQIWCLIPVADAPHLGPVVVVVVIIIVVAAAVHVIALPGHAHHGTADVPAASRDIVTVELVCESNVAREQEARKSKELQGAHCCWIRVVETNWTDGFESRILDIPCA